MKTPAMPQFVDRITDRLESRKDWRETLQIIVRGYSYDQASELCWQGRIPERAWIAYLRVWTWICPRMGGAAGEAQDSFVNRHGMRAYYRRMNRVRSAFGFKLIQPSTVIQ